MLGEAPFAKVILGILRGPLSTPLERIIRGGGLTDWSLRAIFQVLFKPPWGQNVQGMEIRVRLPLEVGKPLTLRCADGGAVPRRKVVNARPS